MTGFSTISSGTIISPLRLNYDIAVNSNSTVSVAYSTAGITDKVGLQVVIYNNSSSTITLTAGTEFTNYTSYAEYCLVLNQLQVPAYQTVTLITTAVGQDYTISAISAMVNFDGGAAGNLIYQQSTNNTTYLASSTSGYVLAGAGTGNPPIWNVLTTGNLKGGTAGSLLYQSAADTTTKTAAGTAFSGSGGGIASMTSGTSVGWNNLAYTNGISSSYSGGTFTINTPRAWTFLCTNIQSGSSGNLYTYMNAQGVPQYDGDTYTVYNDNTINFTLTIQNIQNPNSWSNALITSFAGGANTITLYPHESITFSRYNSTYLTIVSATQSLGLSAIYTIATPTSASAGDFRPSVGTVVYDPQGWNSAGALAFKVTQTGMYRYSIYINQRNAYNIATPYVWAYKNATGGTGYFVRSYGRDVNDNTMSGTYFLTFEVQLNANDYIAFQAASLGSAQWIGGLVTITQLN